MMRAVFEWSAEVQNGERLSISYQVNRVFGRWTITKTPTKRGRFKRFGDLGDVGEWTLRDAEQFFAEVPTLEELGEEIQES